MSGFQLIILDASFVLLVILIQTTHGFRYHPLIFKPLVSLAFATCVIRHVNYYRINKKIF